MVLAGTVPLVELVGVRTNGSPLQAKVDIAVIIALGFTVIVIENGFPEQFKEPIVDLGVTANLTLRVVISALIKDKVVLKAETYPLELFPITELFGVTVPEFQAYNVFNGIILPCVPSTGVIVTGSPEQITLVRLLTTGVGLIVIVKTKEDPVQAAKLGVMVYVAVC